MIQVIVVSLFFGLCFSETRKISSFVNPGCDSECHEDKNVLVHIAADGTSDTLHHIWDFTYKPTVLLAVTPLNSNLSIQWKKFLNGEEGAVQFSLQPVYTFSFVLDQIIEFNDINNTALYDPLKYNSSDVTLYNTHEFDWKFKVSDYQNTSENVFAVMEGFPHKHHGHHKGVAKISLSAYGTMEHSKMKPHLLHTTNASQIDIVLNSFPTTEHFKSRFALKFDVVSSDSPQSTFNHINWKSLDDEHSPGVFTIGVVKSSKGYLEWRTVAYTSAERLMTSSTDVTTGLYNLTANNSLDHTVVSSLYGNLLDNFLVKSVILSFGKPGDEFYSATHFLSWTFLGGIGGPVDEGFSLLVLLIVSIGIGLPALLIIVGGTCIVIKRISKQSHDIVFAEN